MEWNGEIFLKELDFLLRAEGQTLETATAKSLHQAIAKLVLSKIYPDWEKSRGSFQKRCYYFSAEFLIGRSVFSNLLNLGILEEVRSALASRGMDVNRLEEIEDAALGNGGLGRLAACFLESGATQEIPLDGFGLRYRYGLFKQRFENGFQKEYADDWLAFGDPWSIRKEQEKVRVDFADFSVYAVPYDMPVIGYQSGTINTLRLWQSEPIEKFSFEDFDQMEGEIIAKNNFQATQITDVLYPNDSTQMGKILRLRQEYLLVSASLQSIIKNEKQGGRYALNALKGCVFQLNDTHPVLAIPECIRLLEEQGVPFEKALALCRETFHFTNHTIMGEALETWQENTLKEILPEIWAIIEKIQLSQTQEKIQEQNVQIIQNGRVHMANLAIYASRKLNGVAKLHTEILKENTFKEWYKICPQKFENVTNGITPRRWLILNNSKLSKEITDRIGEDWKKDLSQLSRMSEYINDINFRNKFTEIKRENKKRLAEYIAQAEGEKINSDTIFDVQVKRLHEYKRQLLNAFSVAYIYNQLKAGELSDFKPTTFIFGAKAAAGYRMAKAIVKYINTLKSKIDQDKEISRKIKIVFVQNYNVSYAEKIVCAVDVSEQISMAGMEASGTGNMKFMLNGTVTLGTMDGANVEICEQAGKENNYIFGASVEEVERVKKTYNPLEIVAKNKDLQKVTEGLIDGTLSDNGTGCFKEIYQSLFFGDTPDRYLVLYDFESYIKTKLALNKEYGSEEFTTKCLQNMVHAGKFSSDRSVLEYAEKIWEL